MTADARPLAYIAAWARLQAIEEIKHRPYAPNASMTDSMTDDQMRVTQITQLMAEAELYTRLINVPTEVGYAAGDWIQEDEKRREAHIFDDLFGTVPTGLVHCYGCGEKIPAVEAFADGPRPFHFNAEGGGHTCEYDRYTDEERHEP